MIKQQTITGDPKQLHLPLWKRLTLVTAILLSGGPLTVIASTQAAYANPSSPHQHTPSKQKEKKEVSLVNIVVTCKPGNGGKGGKATQKSSGAAGGGGGDCIVTIPIKLLLTEKNNVQHANAVVNAGTVIHASTVLHR
jgi:hypothetical protein